METATLLALALLIIAAMGISAILYVLWHLILRFAEWVLDGRVTNTYWRWHA